MQQRSVKDVLLRMHTAVAAPQEEIALAMLSPHRQGGGPGAKACFRAGSTANLRARQTAGKRPHGQSPTLSSSPFPWLSGEAADLQVHFRGELNRCGVA